ncbi:hypothetical protein [Gluconobacter japonicus]|uniref:Uncharacterized protein n=1 Tax=Gluconobacter japonicus TaxID=376620 RepID=A0ABQ5WEE0_GLUJA|nr:hypothetical protein [Gluconobacter japonicus]KXV29939.1 hypothetical protein AD938_00740 [Gluconobacter japonicus]GBR27963.1 hypothetical protein AA3271_2694 [Gluconobacter japonicus NBRC 3271]GLQ58305.1 hypothetical protein GCM10010937_01060 [Gluconobacter japonicus]
MSETLTPPPGPLGSALAALDAQQARLPEAERGLGKELADLRDRLRGDPALEQDARFTTEVAWLVQDWQAFSGTGEPPRISPVVLAGLQNFAGAVPGLENEEIRSLLERTGELDDRALVQDIRQKALEVAAMSPEEQASVVAARIAAVLDYRFGQAVASPAPAPAPAPAPEATPPVENVAQQPVEPAMAASPAQTERGEEAAGLTPPSPAEAAPAADQPVTPDAPVAVPGDMPQDGFNPGDPYNGGQGDREADGPPDHFADDPGYQASFEREAEMSRAAEDDARQRDGRPPAGPAEAGPPENGNAPGGAARDDAVRAEDNKRATEVENVLPSTENSAAPQGGSARPQQKPHQDASVQKQPNASSPQQEGNDTKPVVSRPDTAASTLAAPGASMRSQFANWSGEQAARSRARFIEERVRKVRDATHALEEDITVLRTVGKEFFEAFDRAVEKEASKDGARTVIAGMTTDGPYKELRSQLDATFSETPAFAAAWNKLRQSAATLGAETQNLMTSAVQRDAVGEPNVKSAEEDAARTAYKLESLPGREPGKDLLKEINTALENLVKQFRNFFTRERQQERERAPDNSPSPGL